jgi:hypothetical protein
VDSYLSDGEKLNNLNHTLNSRLQHRSISTEVLADHFWRNQENDRAFLGVRQLLDAGGGPIYNGLYIFIF